MGNWTSWRWLVKKIISRLARYTPGVFYYSADMPASINGILISIALSEEGERTAMGTAAISFVCAADKHLPKVGDKMTLTLEGVSNSGAPIGSFLITSERLSPRNNSGER